MSKKKNLDSFLSEIFRQFIAIKDEDYKKNQEIFKVAFDQVILQMKEKCKYFSKYSSQIMFAGSVYDGIKVTKLDEFDMNIVIRLPINYDEDLILENFQPGLVKVKLVGTFDHIDKQPEWEKCHKVTRDWRDKEKYFLLNRFRQWMHGTIQRAVCELDSAVTVNGVTYKLTYKESGPAFTLNIRNVDENEDFALDVDLVPVIRLMLPRWPEGYRQVGKSLSKEWYIVPKADKTVPNDKKNLCWRISFQEFEKEMMKGCQNLKTTIRLIKKLRDGLKMDKIASYYIKTLFLWELSKNIDKTFWQNKLSFLFKYMVEVFHDALEKKDIKFFWHENNNLIETLKPTLQRLYIEKLKAVLVAIEANDVEKICTYLLSSDELKIFKESEFYQKQLVNLISTYSTVTFTSQSSVSDSPNNFIVDSLVSQFDIFSEKFSNAMKKIDDISERVDDINRRLTCLEVDKKSYREKYRFYKDKCNSFEQAMGAALFTDDGTKNSKS